MSHSTASASGQVSYGSRYCLSWLVFAAACVSLSGREARASSITPTSGELAARNALGDQIPTAKLLWVNEGKIWYSPVKNWNPELVTSGGNTESRPRWSPDGTEVVFGRDGSGVYLMDFDGSSFSNKRLVYSGAHTADWTADGNAITAIDADGYRVRKHDVASGSKTTIYDARDAGYNGYQVSQAAELRTGNRYLVTFWLDENHNTSIVDLQGKKYIYNAEMDRGDCSPSWSPDGTYVITTARTTDRPVLKANFNASTGTVGSSTYFVGMSHVSYQYYIHGHRVSVGDDDGYVVGGVLYKSGSAPSSIVNGTREIYCWKIGRPDSETVRLTFDTGTDESPSLWIGGSTVNPPSAPSNLTATAVSSSRIDLSWQDNSNNEDGFKIERKTGTGSYSQIATVGAGVRTYSNTGLSSDTTYTYRVRAYNSDGNSSFSNEASAKTLKTAPSAPSNLTASAVSEVRIDLAWNDNSGNEDGFKIERKTGAGSFSQIATVGAGVRTYSNTGLSPDTTYTYRVRAYNSAGNSAYSNEASATTDAEPTVPTTTIDSPASGGGRLVEGSTVDFQGTGQNLVWSYDVVNDGQVAQQFGTGGSASLQVPTGKNPPADIIITLVGDGGTDEQTHTIVSATGGPVLHWKLDETSGLAAADSSGNGHTGTLVNMTGGEWTGEGRIDGALRFVDEDHVLVDPPVALAAEWTFAAWVWAPLVEGTKWTSLTRADTDDHQILISFPSWELGTYENNGSAFNGCGFMMNTLSEGWHHLAAVASGTQTVFYIDGAEVGTANYKSDTDIGVVGNITSGAQRFSEKLDDVRLYERALSPSEVSDLCNVPDAPTITSHPSSTTVTEGERATFTVSAQGTGALHYQWYVDGSAVGTDSATYTTPQTTLSDDGSVIYCVVTDDVGSTQSNTATLRVNPASEPTITVLWPNGGEVLAVGQTYHIRWETNLVSDVTIYYTDEPGGRFQDVAFTVLATDAEWGDLPWTVPSPPSATCRVVIEEYGGDGPLDESDDYFEISADLDADGLPDSWELQYFGDIADCDPDGDSDADGASNYEEHMAGTDPTDASSKPADSGDGGTGFGCAPGEAPRRASGGQSIEGRRAPLLVIAAMALFMSLALGRSRSVRLERRS